LGMVATTEELGNSEKSPQKAVGFGYGASLGALSGIDDVKAATNFNHGAAEVPPGRKSIAEPEELTTDHNKIQDAEVIGQQLERATTTASEKPFSSFTLWQKRMIVVVASLGGFISPLTTNIYFPALNTIAADLGVSISALNLTITTYMIFQGLAPSFIGSFADNQGRRPAYLIGFVIYIGSNIGLAINNSYAGLMVLRCLQSCGSSGMVTLATAVVADVVTSAERGSYIAFTSVGSIMGPSISPVIGGLLSQHLGWHSIFWFLVILSGVFALAILAFYPETCRGIVGDGAIPPPKWNKSLINIHNERRRMRRGEGIDTQHEIAVEKDAKKKSRIPNPLATLRVCMEKETIIILVFGGLIYAGFYAITTTITTQFHAVYHLNDTDLGLIFLPLAVGSVGAAFTNGNLLDRNYRRHAKKAGLPLKRSKQIDMTNFNIERVRLEIGLPFLTAQALFFIAFGWMLEFEVHIAGPLVILIFLGYCAFAGFNTLTVLIIDTHRSNPATASAALNLVRCLLGAGASAVANPMIDGMGRGWAFTFIGLVEFALMPMLLVVMKWGPEWRRQEKRKIEEQLRRREEKKAAKLQAVPQV
jgi:multidrug resistance protein